ncbi:sigma-54 dependent transcriptional regulator [soil metagenome]
MLLGESIQIREIRETIKQVAPTNISVLITGESGSGKEVVAKEIHDKSLRNSKPFITVNCGAIPEGIIESELFGHKRGSFTGAIDDRKGYFETADKGSIFLDEIGEMPLPAQVKLLRVLETGEILPVGGSRTIKVDVRIIAATNRDLAQEVRNKNFREDLYYRLRSINIEIPPLRERKEDIKLLLNSFIDHFSNSNNVSFGGFSDEALDFLVNYNWEGNVRELRNFAESILVLNPGKIIELDDVKRYLIPEKKSNENSFPVLTEFSGQKQRPDSDFFFRALLEIKSDLLDLKDSVHRINQNSMKDSVQEEDFFIPKEQIMNMNMDEIEKEILNYLLVKTNWNVEKVAGILKQTSRNIYRKMKAYNLNKNS